ncbi:hypothetical protein ACRE_083510 [Hapsidospora chrysogenum ATCC 11550]|uniref:Secretory phospholipase A2 n=1 Tax=Hapsidospora chrysogenum (strain ATCC 11550 / CBS 779.69 / DSM 880 / IAM 14645 / JCM 23072 / IMI 49137) TaxID=857340 RepID=A0A086SV22_HAPC1|nr:hypothetical protein ACRE_083510 [Hapsidospora chrysogenum ATCC 11550]
MKFATFALLLPAALAYPTVDREGHLVKRQEAVTDQLLFQLSLPQFIARRDAQDPPELDWSSDSCSSSPDNPFGFPFDPACKRHDFGYRNYKDQGRFTDANKLAIDDNFKADLYYQCSGEAAACKTLADVYYAAVREFGRKKPAGVVSSEYRDAVAAYEKEVKKAQEKGELPAQ